MVSQSLRPREWSRQEFCRLADEGFFGADEHAELWDGLIVTKMTTNARHAVCTRLVSRWLDSNLPAGFDLRVQSPIALSDRSQPEPDIAVVRGAPRDFLKDHPGPKDVVLLVEVADATIRDDLKYKTAIYAGALVPELWIVDINQRRLHVLREPANGVYRDVRIVTPDEMLEASFAGGSPVLVAELLP